MKKLSIIIPIFNEEKNLTVLLKKISLIKLSKIKIEIIAVDDGSTDDSLFILKKFKKIKILTQENQGKGKAVQLGISKSSGDYIIIQDGDLEYDPKDIIKMCNIINKSNKTSIYGSRYLPFVYGLVPKYYKGQNLSSYVANIIFIFLFLILYGKLITDPLTGYKLYKKDFFKNNIIRSKGFEADHEISAKLIKQKYNIIEVPITYKPRTLAEGKKINFFDGIMALFTIIKYRFVN
jgi:dolichol-phosphate mannosyltransferase